MSSMRRPGCTLARRRDRPLPPRVSRDRDSDFGTVESRSNERAVPDLSSGRAERSAKEPSRRPLAAALDQHFVWRY